MYLLRCPKGHDVPVAPTAAGSRVTCPQCGGTVDVPTLGHLRAMPRVSEAPETRRPRRGKLRFGARILFSLLMLAAVAAGISGAFGAVRLYGLPPAATSEQHIDASREEIENFPPATLVAVWSHYEDVGLGERFPFPYERLQRERDRWQRVAVVSGAIAAACVLAAIAVVVLGRAPADTPDT